MWQFNKWAKIRKNHIDMSESSQVYIMCFEFQFQD